MLITALCLQLSWPSALTIQWVRTGNLVQEICSSAWIKRSAFILLEPGSEISVDSCVDQLMYRMHGTMTDGPIFCVCCSQYVLHSIRHEAGIWGDCQELHCAQHCPSVHRQHDLRYLLLGWRICLLLRYFSSPHFTCLVVSSIHQCYLSCLKMHAQQSQRKLFLLSCVWTSLEILWKNAFNRIQIAC